MSLFQETDRRARDEAERQAFKDEAQRQFDRLAAEIGVGILKRLDLDRLGYVLVPKEPTEAMVAAARAVIVNDDVIHLVWRSMIEASQAEKHGPHADKDADEASKQKG